MVEKALCSFLALLCIGCGGSSRDGGKLLTLLAIDTSGSARAYHKEMFQRATEIIQQIPEGQDLYLYRFDSSPAEVLSEPPPAGTAEIAELLNRLLMHESATNGTNLAKLFVEMDQRIAGFDSPVQVIIMTDCGIEEMSPTECEQASRIASKWDSRGSVSAVEFIGVQPDWRSKVRSMVPMSPGKVKFRR